MDGTRTSVTGDVTVTTRAAGKPEGTGTSGKCVLTFAATGSKMLTATYEGHTDNSTSTSPPYLLTVN